MPQHIIANSKAEKELIKDLIALKNIVVIEKVEPSVKENFV